MHKPMKFIDKCTGTIHDVTNEALLPSYEGSERFEKVVNNVVKNQPKRPQKNAKKAED